jgi:glycosyltransferase involved in cell wall biosynthesis
MKPLAIVIPWFGRELNGGAEQQAWQIASRLSVRGHRVEVLTTCCRSFLENWEKNHLKAGKSHEDGLVIRRFKVDKRRANLFNFVNSMMLSIPSDSLMPGCNPVTKSDAEIFVKDNINSNELLNHLKRNASAYHAFLFIPYLYGPILNGLPLVADRAYLQPCLHDEVYAYLPQVENNFRIAHRILFNSEGELRLASRLYGPGILSKSVVTGEGVELPKTNKGARAPLMDSLGIEQNRYILYLGRRDQTKNVDLLIRAFVAYKCRHPDSDINLLLAGPGNLSLSNEARCVYDFGLVSEEQKTVLLANCLALFQPSRKESYSRVIMEAWYFGRPVAAHRKCEATAAAVRSAGGGWLAGDESEWTDLIGEVNRADTKKLSILGAKGQSYSEKFGDWSPVIDCYEKTLQLDRHESRPAIRGRGEIRTIHQLTSGFEFGDAITNQTILIRDHLRCCGILSDIFAQYIDPKMSHIALKFEPDRLGTSSGLLYHHSIGSDLTQFALKHNGPKCLIYHNITPAEFLKSYNLKTANLLEQGRADLNRLARSFKCAVGVSNFNRAELADHGFLNPGVLPICVDPSRWNSEPDRELMKNLQDGTTNLLFVGRVVPNKCQHHLLEAFSHYLTFDSKARLIIVGEINPRNLYNQQLLQIVERLGLRSKVVITGKISYESIQAFYRTAHLYWSMSEHEGFGVPLIEAMWFDIPVLAYKSTAVPETLGIGGITFTQKKDFNFIAALARTIVTDGALRSKIIEAQRLRREDFLPEAVVPRLDALIEKMVPYEHRY